ncbi:Mobile element protein [Methanosarcina sp. MTP4]|nr:Mobile element protein [Methanosarcina sp. MTP4]
MYHIIFVCKYRKKLLQPIDKELKDLIYLISESSDFEIVEMETDKDHIHLLVKSKPKIGVLSIVRKLKQLTTYVMENSKTISETILQKGKYIRE